MNSFNIISLLLTTIIYKTTAKIVVIECTFPCLENNEHVCEVTDEYVKCKQRTKKTKWILKNTISLPVYLGTRVELGQTCSSVPQPKLKDGSHLSKNSSESIMEWPPQASLTDYDLYYSNCAESLYCNKENICVKQFVYGEICESDNQCFQGLCDENICKMETIEKNDNRKGLNTVHIILTVIGIVLFFAVIIAIYWMKRRKKQKKLKSNDKKTIRSNSTTSTNSNHSSNHIVTNILQPDYESTFINSSSNASNHQHTPSMQQQELQFQLQRQLLYDNQPKVQLPPPPYSP